MLISHCFSFVDISPAYSSPVLLLPESTWCLPLSFTWLGAWANLASWDSAGKGIIPAMGGIISSWFGGGRLSSIAGVGIGCEGGSNIMFKGWGGWAAFGAYGEFGILCWFKLRIFLSSSSNVNGCGWSGGACCCCAFNRSRSSSSTVLKFAWGNIGIPGGKPAGRPVDKPVGNLVGSPGKWTLYNSGFTGKAGTPLNSADGTADHIEVALAISFS